MNEAFNRARDGLAACRVAQICRVHRITAARWCARESRAPYAVIRLLELEVGGAIPAPGGPAWRDWRFGGGLLYAPDLARGFSTRDLYQLHWLQQAAAWRAAQARTIVRQPA